MFDRRAIGRVFFKDYTLIEVMCDDIRNHVLKPLNQWFWLKVPSTNNLINPVSNFYFIGYWKESVCDMSTDI